VIHLIKNSSITMNGAQLRKSAFNTPVSVVNSDKKRQIILLFFQTR